MHHWDDLNARARGLASHLIPDEELDRIDHANSLPAIAELLSHHGYPLTEPHLHSSAGGLDLAARRAAAHNLGLISRWAGSERRRALAAVFEHEDLVSLRHLLRGLAAGVSLERRLAGCLPTPLLSEKALEELARQASFTAVGGRLEAWGNPYAGAVLAAAPDTQPDLMRLELGLSSSYAERAVSGAGRGDRALAAFVSSSMDLENLRSALLLSGAGASGGSEVEPAGVFLAGGRAMAKTLFVTAAKLPPAQAVAALEKAFAGSWLAGLAALPPSRFDDEALVRFARQLSRLSRLEPWTSAPVLSYLLARRGELYRVRRAVWALALAEPLAPSSAGSPLEAA